MQNDELKRRLELAVLKARWGDVAMSVGDVIQKIGEPNQELGQSRKKVLIGCGIALLILPLGCGFFWAMLNTILDHFQNPDGRIVIKSPIEWIETVFGLLVGIVGILYALFRFRWGYKTWNNVTFFGSDGFFYRLRHLTGVLRFDEIASIQERTFQKSVTIHGGPIMVETPTGKAFSYVIVTKSGDKIKVDSQDLANMKWFGTNLRKEAIHRQIPFSVKQIG